MGLIWKDGVLLLPMKHYNDCGLKGLKHQESLQKNGFQVTEIDGGTPAQLSGYQIVATDFEGKPEIKPELNGGLKPELNGGLKAYLHKYRRK